MEDPHKERPTEDEQGNSLTRINRNLSERNRRLQMNDLYSKLFSLIPTTNSKSSVADLVDQAICFIKELQEKIEKLREKKDLLKGDDENFEPLLNIISQESTMEVTIVSGLEKNFSLHQVVSVLQQEGAEVVSITCHNADGRVFFTILAQAVSSRIGIETSRVDERLRKLIS